jgi:hypothetical protein
MRRIAASLIVLLLILTFNAYACLLPLPSGSAIDCSSAAEQPMRQTCDAFLELGPQSQSSITQELPTFNGDFDAALQLPTSIFLAFRSEQPPQGAETPIHPSIPTTVLRI